MFCNDIHNFIPEDKLVPNRLDKTRYQTWNGANSDHSLQGRFILDNINIHIHRKCMGYEYYYTMHICRVCYHSYWL